MKMIDMRRLVIKLSGHIFFSNKINVDLMSRYSKIIRELHRRGERMVIVVGGGSYARKYIEAADHMKASEFEKDYLGILITHGNAFLFATALGEIAYKPIPRNIDEIMEAAENKDKVVICGGLVPGQSTMTVAAMVAEALRANLIINATDVDGIYDKDPKKNPDAKMLRKVTVKDLRRILGEGEFKAGTYRLIDPHALRIIERAKIPVKVLNGFDERNIIRAIEGEDVGTTIIVH